MYSQNESWLVGAFHDGSSKNDQWKYTTFAGAGEFHLKFYGLGGSNNQLKNPIKYDIKPLVFQGEITKKIGRSNWYSGARALVIRADSRLHNIGSVTIPDFYQDHLSINGLGIVGTYDSRDNNYFAEKGMKLDLELMQFMPALDDDHNYQTWKANYRYYFTPMQKLSFATQAKYEEASKSTPFFQIPVLTLRGSEFGQFQDYLTLQFNVEALWKLFPRWKLVAFIDSGTVANGLDDVGNKDYFKSFGTGVRWQVTEDKELNFSADIAILEGDASLILRVGEAF